jgi:hypothetical protein
MISLRRCWHIIAVLTVCVVVMPGVLSAQDVIAYIGQVGGSVTIARMNPEDELEATVGMLLVGGDTVSTSTGSYASVIFQDDGSRVKLGENSQLTLNATRDQKKLKKRMFLDSGGKIWAKVAKKKGADFQVKTPTSVASVKGTEFVLLEDNYGAWVYVLDGNVNVSRDNYSEDVGAGQYARTSEDGIETGDIQDGDVPVEPGPHELIFFFDQNNQGTVLQKELHIEFER